MKAVALILVLFFHSFYDVPAASVSKIESGYGLNTAVDSEVHSDSGNDLADDADVEADVADSSAKILSKVTCYVTVDNSLEIFAYNGKRRWNVKSNKKRGSFGNWMKPKKITFNEVKGGVVAIRGQNYEATTGSATCRTAGLAMSCKSTNPKSGWHNWVASQKTMRSVGRAKRSDPAHNWMTNSLNDKSWQKPCVSTSGFYMHVPASYKKPPKIWGGNKFSWFRSKKVKVPAGWFRTSRRRLPTGGRRRLHKYLKKWSTINKKHNAKYKKWIKESKALKKAQHHAHKKWLKKWKLLKKTQTAHYKKLLKTWYALKKKHVDNYKKQLKKWNLMKKKHAQMKAKWAKMMKWHTVEKLHHLKKMSHLKKMHKIEMARHLKKLRHLNKLHKAHKSYHKKNLHKLKKMHAKKIAAHKKKLKHLKKLLKSKVAHHKAWTHRRRRR